MSTAVSRRESLVKGLGVMTAVALSGVAETAHAETALSRVILNRARSQPIASRVLTQIMWDTPRENAAGWWHPAEPGTIRVAQSGLYLVTMQLCWTDHTDTTDRAHHLELDGAIVQAFAFNPTRWNGTSSVNWMGTMLAGSELELFVYQSSGVTLGFGGYNRPSATVGVSANCEICVTRLGL
jgi:hypothetical protein